MTFRCPPWPPDLPEIERSIALLIQSGDWARYKSPQQQMLRHILSELCQTRHVRLCASGSAAVEIALRASGVGRGDGVILAAYDYPGNFRAVEAMGATPVLVDVAADEVTIDIEQVAQIEPADDIPPIRAVIASHLYGTAAPIAKLRAICDQRDWVLIEDACQVPGMTIDGAPAGSIGHLSTLSFGGSKPLTAGNGGAVLTNDDRFSARMNAYLDRPSDSQPLSSMQATVLLPQLHNLSTFNQTRRATADYLQANVMQDQTGWQWFSRSRPSVDATHYKVAWACESAERRRQIIKLGLENGLPIGEGFRSMSRSSERRCRKPFPLEQSSKRDETTVVLDHSALLIKARQHDELALLLRSLQSV